MKGSLSAILRALVLPFGATSGPRIVLDGVNGEITAYGSVDTNYVKVDSDLGVGNPGVLVNATDGSFIKIDTSGNAEMVFQPAASLATYQSGAIQASLSTGPDFRPRLALLSPVYTGGVFPHLQAGVLLDGEGVTTTIAEVTLDGDIIHIGRNISGLALDLGTSTAYTPTWTGSVANPTGQTISGTYEYLHRHRVKAVIKCAATGKGNGTFSWTLPVNSSSADGDGAVGSWWMNDSGSAIRGGPVILTAAGTIQVAEDGAGGNFAAVNWLGGAAASSFRIDIDYPV